MSKTCKSCGEVKVFSSFTKSSNIKDGYENTCKPCRQNRRKKYTNKCTYCEATFRTANPNTEFCSKACAPQSRKVRVVVSCYICGEKKGITKSRELGYKHFYCTDTCKNKGYSKLYSGKDSVHYNTVSFSCAVCGKECERWASQVGRHSTNYCSVDCLGEDYKTRFSGESNPNYNKYKSEEDRVMNRNIEGYPEWRRKVFETDSYTCVCCEDSRGGNLVAHHILNYSEHPHLRTEESNGVTMCYTCHKGLHDTFGYTNNTKEHLTEYLKLNKQSKAPVPQ